MPNINTKKGLDEQIPIWFNIIAVNITTKLPQLAEKDKLLLELPELEYELYRVKLLRKWKKGQCETATLSSIEVELINQYCLSDIDWNDNDLLTEERRLKEAMVLKQTPITADVFSSD